MDKVKINYLVDIILLIMFLVVTITGIMKLPIFKGIVSRSAQLSMVHDYSGVLMAVLVLIHLALNWNFLACMTKKYLGRNKAKCD
jgi:hypothetical protein